MELAELVALFPGGMNECTLCGEGVIACRHLNDKYMVLHKGDGTRWFVCIGDYKPLMRDNVHLVAEEKYGFWWGGPDCDFSRIEVFDSFEEGLKAFKQGEELFIQKAGLYTPI